MVGVLGKACTHRRNNEVSIFCTRFSGQMLRTSTPPRHDRGLIVWVDALSVNFVFYIYRSKQ